MVSTLTRWVQLKLPVSGPDLAAAHCSDLEGWLSTVHERGLLDSKDLETMVRGMIDNGAKEREVEGFIEYLAHNLQVSRGWC